jgi:ubiquinone/menaquinone biosynthesis C-methylase UbiE
MLQAIRKLRLQLFGWVASSLVSRVDLGFFEPPPTTWGRLFKSILRLFADSTRLESVLMGPLSLEFVRTGCNVGLFDLLQERPGLTLEELHRTLKIAVYPLAVILPGLCSLGLLHKIGGQFYNAPLLVQPFLKGAYNDLFRKHLEYMHHVIAPAGMYLQETVLENRPVGLHQLFGQTDDYYHAISIDVARRPYFYNFIGTYTQVNRDRVAGLPFFSAFPKILDAGGNTGEMSLAIARHHPAVTVTVFDFPAAVAQASERFQGSGMEERLAVLAGNFFQDGFPTGFDCILLSHFMEMLSPEDYQEYLREAFEQLPPGGAVCIFTPVIRDDETGPLSYTIISAYFMFLANGQGRLYSARSISTWLEDVGFVDIERHLLPINEVVLVGRKSGNARPGRDRRQPFRNWNKGKFRERPAQRPVAIIP